MNFLIQPNRIYAEDSSGRLLAEVTYSESEGCWNIEHTFVDDSLRGQGIAGQLMQTIADQAKSQKKRLLPVCSYAVQWFHKHKEQYQELLKQPTE